MFSSIIDGSPDLINKGVQILNKASWINGAKVKRNPFKDSTERSLSVLSRSSFSSSAMT